MEKIRIIIADDNVALCDILKVYLKQFKDIEIVGIAHTDEDEIKLIETLNPDVIITDLMRNARYTGLDIIKEYNSKNMSKRFLVISADEKKEVIDDKLVIGGYIKKPFIDYTIIINEIRKIKETTTAEKNQLFIKQNTEKLVKYSLLRKIMNMFKFDSNKNGKG